MRKYYMHAAHETIGVSNATAALRACRPVRVCLVCAGGSFPANDPLAAMEGYLAEHSTTTGDEFSWVVADWADATSLREADTVLLYGRPEEDRIRRVWQSGRGIVGVRPPDETVPDGSPWKSDVFGCQVRGCYPDRRVRVTPVEQAWRHPVLRGVDSFAVSGSLPRHAWIAPDATVLLQGRVSEGNEPVAWVRTSPHGRVFHTSLGHPADFDNGAFLRLLANAVFWTAGRSRD